MESSTLDVDQFEEVKAEGRGEFGQKVGRIKKTEGICLLVAMQLVIRSELNVEKTIVYAETHVKNTHK